LTQYLVAIYHPDDYDPSTEDQAMPRDIDALHSNDTKAFVFNDLASTAAAQAVRQLA